MPKIFSCCFGNASKNAINHRGNSTNVISTAPSIETRNNSPYHRSRNQRNGQRAEVSNRYDVSYSNRPTNNLQKEYLPGNHQVFFPDISNHQEGYDYSSDSSGSSDQGRNVNPNLYD